MNDESNTQQQKQREQRVDEEGEGEAEEGVGGGEGGGGGGEKEVKNSTQINTENIPIYRAIAIPSSLRSVAPFLEEAQAYAGYPFFSFPSLISLLIPLYS